MIHGVMTIVVASTVFTAFFITFTSIGILNRGIAKPIDYCYLQLLFSPTMNISYSVGLLALLAFTCLMMVYVKLKNQHLWTTFGLGSTGHSLAQRFAISANINTAEWLIPISIFETVAAVFCVVWWSLAEILYADCLTVKFLSYVNVTVLFVDLKYVISAVMMMR